MIVTTLKIPVSEHDHSQGSPDALLTLVEYGDYQCSYCGLAYPIVKRVQHHFGAKLRFVFRNFPLAEAHPQAEAAAEIAEFAGAVGKFWEMHDLLYENQSDLGLELYRSFAPKFGLSSDRLQNALETATYRERVRADFMGGVHSGVNGTPTFFINGTRHDASYDFGVLVAALIDVLASI
jgi:protein-disulfide isomerase